MALMDAALAGRVAALEEHQQALAGVLQPARQNSCAAASSSGVG
jgi:hypothetical protein